MAHLLGWGCAILVATTWASAIPQQTVSLSSKPPSSTISTSAPTITQPTATRTSILSLPEDDSARTCWSSYYSWSILSGSISSSAYNFPWTPVTTIPTYITTICCGDTTENLPVTTLCDGYPRLAGTPRVFHNISIITTIYNYTSQTRGPLPSLTEEKPECSIDNSEPACTRFWDDWNSHSFYRTAYDDFIYYGTPPCTSPLSACPPPSSTKCSVSANGVTMYYWPQTTLSGGDFCAKNGTTLTPSPTNPPFANTVTSGDITFTSPSVYLVASRVFGWVSKGRFRRRERGNLCGKIDTSVTYTVDPEDISTMQWLVKGNTFSMDWTDLTTIHRDAFERNCYDVWCTRRKTITPGGVPFVALPSGVHTEEREWVGCEGRPGFIPVMVPLGEAKFEDDGGGEGDSRNLQAESLSMGSPTAPATNVDAGSTQTQGVGGASSMPTLDLDTNTDGVEEVNVIISSRESYPTT